MIDHKPDLIETLAREGVDLRRGWGLCPFHADKHPSMKINRDTQTFHCFSCGAHGDVIDFIQKFHNLNFKDALKYLEITPGKPPQVDPIRQRKKELLARFEKWRGETCRDLCDEYNAIWHGLRRCRNMDEISELSEIMCEMGPMEDTINILSRKDEGAIYEIYCASIQPV